MQVLFADDALLVVDKPSGLLSVPGRGEDKADCLSARIQARYPDALIVHRLDMATSGLIVVARGKSMQRELSIQFRDQRVAKRYAAVVNGKPAAASGEIDLPLIVDWPNRPRRKIDYATGKPSRTRFRVLDYNASDDATRLELEPLTGRTHQLRVHMLAIGHPILGDALYADAEIQAKAGRLLLHASHLAFTHPLSDESMSFSSPAPF